MHQTTAKEQSANEQLFSLNVERVRLINSRRVRTPTVANQQRVFQVPSLFQCDYIGHANRLQVCFVDAVARWLFATPTTTAHPILMELDNLRESRVQLLPGSSFV